MEDEYLLREHNNYAMLQLYNYKYNTKYVTLRPQKCCELGELEAGDVLLRVSINIILRYSGLLFFSICVLQLYGFI